MNESIQKIDYEQLETFLFALGLIIFFFIIFIKIGIIELYRFNFDFTNSIDKI